MSDLRFTLVADGPGDRALRPALEWLLERHSAKTFRGEFPDLGRLRRRPRTLRERIETAIDLAPCELLFVHRDAERQDPEMRHDEIEVAAREVGVPPYVAVVPVRMTEAWLLWNEGAIREAAGNPRGRESLRLPSPREVEGVADPKALLHDALRVASGHSGRRLDAMRTGPLSHRVADLIGDYAPLLGAPAFARLDRDLASVIAARRW